MDLATQRAMLIAPMHLKKADGTLMYATGDDGNPDPDRPCRVWLHGPASSKMAEERRRLERDVMEAMADAGKKKQKASADSFLSAERKAKFLVAITDRWENVTFTNEDGSMVAPEGLSARIYNDAQLGYIIDDADRFSQSWANFMPGSPTNSSSTSASVPG